jgi:hypothetical protein
MRECGVQLNQTTILTLVRIIMNNTSILCAAARGLMIGRVSQNNHYTISNDIVQYDKNCSLCADTEIAVDVLRMQSIRFAKI